MNTSLKSVQELLAADLDAYSLKTHIRDELYDHLSCILEEATERGDDLQAVYRKAWNEVCPQGPAYLQTKINQQIQQSKPMKMKKPMHILAYLATFCFSNSVFFKIMHWPGANMLFLASVLLFVIALSLLIYTKFFQRKAYQSNRDWLQILLGYLGFGIVLVGSTFKIMHWPMANILLGLGIIVLNLGFFPLFFAQMFRKATA